jgi:hypothetical protein
MIFIDRYGRYLHPHVDYAKLADDMQLLKAFRWVTPRRILALFLSSHPADDRDSSLGASCEASGWNKIWQATGAVQHTYNSSLSRKITKCIEENWGDYPVNKQLTFSMYMVGQDKQSASPTVIFCSECQATRKMARRLIEESLVLEEYPRFTTWDLPREPPFGHTVERLSGVHSDEASRVTTPGVWLSSNEKHLRGTRIWTTHSNGTSQKATSSVLFRDPSDNSLYLTTVDHCLESSPPQSLLIQDGYQSHDLSVDMGLNERNTDTQTHSTVVSTSNGTVLPVQHETDIHGSDVSTSKAFNHEGPVPLELTLRDESTDFALLKLAVDAKDIPYPVPTLGELLDTVTSMPEDTRVRAFTASSGLIYGTMSGTSSFLMAPGSRRFREVWIVRFDRPVAKGDCGSIVQHSENGTIYGHIIAGSPPDGVAYISPAYLFLTKLKDQFTDNHADSARDSSSDYNSRDASRRNLEVQDDNPQLTETTPNSSWGLNRIEDNYPGDGWHWTALTVAAGGFLTMSYAVSVGFSIDWMC